MFDRNEWYTRLSEALERDSDGRNKLDADEKRLLFRVELGLYLLEALGFSDQPVDALWTVLSGLPFPSIVELRTEQRRWIAISRILLPFSSRSSWEQALHQYLRLPLGVRLYDISDDFPFEEQILDACRSSTIKSRARREVYQRALNTIPPPARSKRSFARAGEAKITINTDKGPFSVTVTLPDFLTEDLPSPEVRSPKASRSALPVTFEALQGIAAFMDQRLRVRGREPMWVDRVEKSIHYHGIHNGDVSDEANNTAIHLDGGGHIVGMVGSGKSTLMKLIAAYVAVTRPETVLVLVVGDTMTVFDIVEELNAIIADDQDHPVALPLVGRSTRHNHLKRLWNREHPETHGALRWLNTACPLMGLMSSSQIATLEGNPLPGREPCEQVYQKSERPTEDNDSLRPHLCPLFSRCPSQQLWHDLPSASIYVTTPGAIAKSGVPTQVDRRRLRYGEFIYMEADYVIFDEADTVMQWFDNEYATVLDLWGREKAVFTQADPLASQSLTSGVSFLEERWIRAERLATLGIVDILRQLSRSRDASTLRRWIGARYFTASYLFHNLTMSLLGLPATTILDEQTDDVREAYQALLRDLEIVADKDPLRYPRPRREQYRDEGIYDHAVAQYRLAELMRQASIDGVDTIISECKTWIQDHVPQIEANISNLNDFLKTGDLPIETLEALALKLAFALSVALLDRNLRIVFYEWYNQPEEVQEALGEQPYRPSSVTLADVLPIPPTGRIFGTYYISRTGEDDDVGLLSRFEYSNVGRHFLLHYHELLSLLDMPGPHTLALSGTSWLPYSTQWHIDLPIQGILQTPKAERERIRKHSQFYYRPHYYPDGSPIVVSGVEDKTKAMSALAQAMIRSNILVKELHNLSELARANPELWDGREKLLLLTNSYSQAKAFAKTLADYWADRSEIFYLTSSNDQTGDGGVQTVGTLVRADVESFAETHGRILIAPMAAIGRGYNILTLDRKRAAFGAVFFLVRPMPHPYDVQALAGELNAYTLATCANQSDPLWENPGVYAQARAFRSAARAYWVKAEMRQGYRTLSPDERQDLAATTFGQFVQASGRLVRGGVPFHTFFVDASWAPKSATPPEHTTPQTALDSVKDSLLTQMVLLLEEYIDESPIGRSLYQPFEGLVDIDGFYPNRKGNR
jgi:hypothetical protein